MLHKNFMRRRSRMFEVQALHEVLCLFFGDTPVVEGQASLSCSAPGGQYLLLGFLYLGYEAVAFSLL